MRKLIVCAWVSLITLAIPFTKVTAGERGGSNSNGHSESRLENRISEIYHQIRFTRSRLSYEAFKAAYHGYLNLRNAGKLNTDKNVLSVCDFDLPSTKNRLWVIDLDSKRVLFNTHVAHGSGSGDVNARCFSNNANSHQSSLGFYVTGNTYQGSHGTSLRLLGMDQGFNDAACDRDIVVHGADYVCDRGNNRCGRSWGCPAVAPALSRPIINAIKGGTCLFIYYPQARYLRSSRWLNHRASYITEKVLPNIATDIPSAAVKTLQYISNGKIDSVIKSVPIFQ